MVSAPHLTVHFVRPLASALFTLDHSLWSTEPLGYHLQSLLWWAALLLVARAGYARWLPQPTATLALAVYAWSGIHSYPVGWASARHGLLATVAVAAGLTALARPASATARRVAAGAFSLGLFASEAALGGLAFALAYEFARPPAASARTRARRSLLWLAIGVVYVVGYVALGAGVRDSGAYLSPFLEPRRFAAAALVRAPVFLADAFVGIPVEAMNFLPHAPLVIVGLVASAILLIAWRLVSPRVDEAERFALSWLVPGALLAMASTVGAYPGARLLEIPELGFAALVAVVIRHAFRAGAYALWRRAIGAGLVLIHGIVSPLIGLANVSATVDIRRKVDGVSTQVETLLRGADRAFLIAASDPMAALYAPLEYRAQSRGVPCGAWILGAKADVEVTRTSPSSLVLESLDKTMLTGGFDEVYRDPALPFAVGDEASVCGGRVRVLAVEGGRPSRVELRLEALDAPGNVLMAWQNGALRRFTPPALGAMTVVTWSPGPSGFF